jgi:type II secretory pathway pseudopilin PulG
MSTLPTQSRSAGFSLVEILVYIAVTVSITLAGVLTYLSLSSGLARNATERAVNHAAQVALERITRDIRGAITVNAAQSTLGSSPSVLTLSNSATTTQYSIVSGALSLSVDGKTVGPLTGSGISVDNFTVNRYVGTSTELVRVKLTLSAVTKAASTTRTYYTSAVLRGSYE